MTTVTLPIMAACPSCRNLMSVNLMDFAPRCNRCSMVWGNRYGYDVAMSSACGTPMPTYPSTPAPAYTPPVYTPVPPAPVPYAPVPAPVEDKYIKTGQMKEDIEKLVEYAVAERLLNFTDRLAYDVRRINDATSQPQVRLRAIVDVVNRARDEAQMDWAEVDDNDSD